MGLGMITPTAHEKSEWARMADCCAKAGKATHACLYKAAAVLEGPMKPWTYDALQKNYRHWLLGGTLPDEGLEL